MGFSIQDLLHEDAVIVNLEASDYEEVIKKLKDVAFENGYVERGYANAVIERERLYPTALPTEPFKVAIPHPMEQNTVKKSTIVIAKLANSVNFVEMGTEDVPCPVDMVFALAVCGTEDQLTILQDLIGLFSNQEAMLKLQSANTPADIVAAITELIG